MLFKRSWHLCSAKSGEWPESKEMETKGKEQAETPDPGEVRYQLGSRWSSGERSVD